MTEIARSLRTTSTNAEKLFWEAVRDRRLGGIKFHRQKPIDKYVVDFYCHAAKLIIELDGEVHDDPEQQKRDAIREQILRKMGFNILRITNNMLLTRPESTLESVLLRVKELISEPK